MATTTQKVLRMSFSNAAGGSVTMTLPEPRPDVTALEIEAVMDQIIAKNIFTSSGGDLISKRDIKIVDTTTNDLYDLPVA